jgi:hypothetical protein
MLHLRESLSSINLSHENRIIAVVLAFVFAAMIAISIFIPLISNKKDQQIAYVYHPHLYPFYYQTNADAQMELLSSLGFPEYFKTCDLRINRPLILGTIAALRSVVVNVAHVLLPGSDRAQWGEYSALSVMITYSLWILINITFIGLAMVACFKAFAPIVGKSEGAVAAVLFCTSPIVLLSIREIGEGSVQILLVALSVLFWKKIFTENVSPRRLILLSLVIGILFLGKFAMTTFAAGCCICLFTPKRNLLGLIIFTVIMPMLIWICICSVFGLPFSIAEIAVNAPAIRGALSLSFFQRLMAFSSLWTSVLAEDGLFLQMPLALLGLFWLVKNKHPLLRFVPIFAIIDFCFYCILGRTHAVYGLHTMIFYYPLVAVGIVRVSRRLSQKINMLNWEQGIALILALVMQGALIAIVVPGYGG